MGFSTSGSLLVIFIALFAALGSVYTTTSNQADKVTEANADRLQHQQAVLETSINVTEATWDQEAGRLNVTVNNTGSTTLSVNATDLLVNGKYVADWHTAASVDGVGTDIWASGEALRIDDETAVDATVADTPDRIRIVTEVGIAVQADVEVI
jgi:flagellar protein FlaF